ncbi:MAG: hypothetical protein ACK5JO_03515 [Halodesulfovibrio sp.]
MTLQRMLSVVGQDRSYHKLKREQRGNGGQMAGNRNALTTKMKNFFSAQSIPGSDIAKFVLSGLRAFTDSASAFTMYRIFGRFVV